MKKNTFLVLFLLFLGVQTVAWTMDEAAIMADRSAPEVTEPDYAEDTGQNEENDEEYDLPEGHEKVDGNGNIDVSPAVPEPDYDSYENVPTDQEGTAFSAASNAIGEGGITAKQEDIVDKDSVERGENDPVQYDDDRQDAVSDVSNVDFESFFDPKNRALSRGDGVSSIAGLNHLGPLIDAGPQNSIEETQPQNDVVQASVENRVLSGQLDDVGDLLRSLNNDNDQEDVMERLERAKSNLKKLENKIQFNSSEKQKLVVLKDALVQVQEKIGVTDKDRAQQVKYRVTQLDSKVNTLKTDLDLLNSNSNFDKQQDFIKIATQVKEATLELQSLQAKVGDDAKRTGRDWNLSRERYGRGEKRLEKAGERATLLELVKANLEDLSSKVDGVLKERGITDALLQEDGPEKRRTATIAEDQRKTLTPERYASLQGGIDSSSSDIEALKNKIEGVDLASMGPEKYHDAIKPMEREYTRLVKRVEKQLDGLAAYHDAQTRDGVSSTSAKRLENREYALEDELRALKDVFNDKKSFDTLKDRRQLTGKRESNLKGEINQIYTGGYDRSILDQRRTDDELNTYQTEVNRHPDRYQKTLWFRNPEEINNVPAKRRLTETVSIRKKDNGYKPESAREESDQVFDAQSLDEESDSGYYDEARINDLAEKLRTALSQRDSSETSVSSFAGLEGESNDGYYDENNEEGEFEKVMDNPELYDDSGYYDEARINDLAEKLRTALSQRDSSKTSVSSFAGLEGESNDGYYDEENEESSI